MKCIGTNVKTHRKAILTLYMYIMYVQVRNKICFLLNLLARF